MSSKRKSAAVSIKPQSQNKFPLHAHLCFSPADIALPIGVIIGAVSAVAILIGVIVLVIWRHRRIAVKYSKLLQEHPMELGDMDDS